MGDETDMNDRERKPPIAKMILVPTHQVLQYPIGLGSFRNHTIGLFGREADMYTMLVKDKLFEQSQVYHALKSKETASIQYSGYKDEKWGIQDANYLNRMRLAYYLLYARIDDEEAILYLFQEELKDRKSNSFQGIGNTLNVLTSILKRYNNDGRYNGILEEAKNANFDCACGYDKNVQINDEVDSLELMDCIFLAQDLAYKDVMEALVHEWKKSIMDWTDTHRNTLIRFNSFLGKEQENEAIYKVILDHAIISGQTVDIVSAYNKVIRYYLNREQLEIAVSYLWRMIAATEFKDIERIRLFGDVLEECFDLISGGVKDSAKLWEWAKPYLKTRTNMYGNLYKKAITAAKTVGDSYFLALEQEYIDWKKKVGLQ